MRGESVERKAQKVVPPWRILKIQHGAAVWKCLGDRLQPTRGEAEGSGAGGRMEGMQRLAKMGEGEGAAAATRLGGW